MSDNRVRPLPSNAWLDMEQELKDLREWKRLHLNDMREICDFVSRRLKNRYMRELAMTCQK